MEEGDRSLQTDHEKLKERVLKALLVLIILACLILFVYYFAPVFSKIFFFLMILILPFILAWLIAIMTKPWVEFFVRRFHFSRKLSVLLIVVFLLAVFGTILTLIIARLINAISGFVAYLPQAQNGIYEYFEGIVRNIDKMNLAQSDLSSIQSGIDTITNAIASFANYFTQSLIGIVQGTPTGFFMVLVTVVATYFWCLDNEKVQNMLINIFPKRHREAATITYQNFSNVISGFCIAQIILVAITTAICIIALFIIGVDGAFTIGLIAGLLDFIPVLGPGTIIVPWGIIALLTGDYFTGVGMLVLFLVLTITRNLLQPKVVGDRVGLHPLASLASMFIGFEIIGVLGIIIGPLVAALIISFFRTKKEVADKIPPAPPRES